MLLGGIWHGASWTMVLWGAFHGAILIIHRLSRGSAAPERGERRSLLKILFMFHVTCFGWLIFRAATVSQIGRFVRGIVTSLKPTHFTGAYASLLAQLVVPLLLFEIWLYRTKEGDSLFDRVSASTRICIACGVSFATLVFIVFHRSLLQSEIPFIYFQF
jgi:hypothetical protein